MTRFEKLGWIVAAAVVGLMAASGFQTGMDKVATVNLQNLVDTSTLGKANSATFDKMKAAREGLLQFMDENRVLTMDQATQLRDLSLKDTLTTEEKAKLERIKADVIAQAKRNLELSNKPNLTPEERQLLQEYSSRSAAIENLENQWVEEFRGQMQQWAIDKKVESLNIAKATAKAIAKEKGYSLVFDQSVALYSPNDLTEDTLKAMNAKS